MNKIGIFISMFSNDTIENSISYITKLCLNIKAYNEFRIEHNNVDLIVHTDEFTYKIIVDLCRQEKILLDNIIFHKHRRNTYLRGMFWRFESFYTNDYDITINGEGDYSLNKYFKKLEYFEKQEFILMLHSVREIEISLAPIAAGITFIKPKLIDTNIKNKMKDLIELFDHIDDIDYGIDEYFFIRFLKKNFYDKNILFIVNNRLSIKDAIKNYDIEIPNIKKYFPNATFITVQEFELLIKDNSKYIFNTYEYLDYHIKTINDKLCYTLYGQCLKIKQPFRVNRSEFCQKRLLNLLEPII